MAITLETLKNDELGPDADVYVDVADYSDTVLTLKQDGDWVSLDRRQQRALYEFLRARLEPAPLLNPETVMSGRLNQEEP